MTQQSTPFDLRTTREYRELGFKIVNCPVCGKETLDSHWICQHCGWEYEGTIKETEYSASNKATVAEYRKNNL